MGEHSKQSQDSSKPASILAVTLPRGLCSVFCDETSSSQWLSLPLCPCCIWPTSSLLGHQVTSAWPQLLIPLIALDGTPLMLRDSGWLLTPWAAVPGSFHWVSLRALLSAVPFIGMLFPRRAAGLAMVFWRVTFKGSSFGPSWGCTCPLHSPLLFFGWLSPLAISVN